MDAHDSDVCANVVGKSFLQKKRVVIVDEEKLNGQTVTEIWFDCDTLASLSEDASDNA